jgi:hypothetical protein
MNNLFDPKSQLGSAFNEIFGQNTEKKPDQSPPAGTKKHSQAVARIGAARPLDSATRAR